MKNLLTVDLPCKPYVKRFIEQNFGSPADFSRDGELYEYFRSKLVRNSIRQDRLYSKYNLDKYSESIKVIVTSDDFYRFGWEMSTTDTVRLNKKLECRVKLLAHMVISSQMVSGRGLTSSVDYFQMNFGFTEDVWKKESIIKECQRNMSMDKQAFPKNMAASLQRTVLDKLSVVDVVSKKGKKKYLEKLSGKRTTLL